MFVVSCIGYRTVDEVDPHFLQELPSVRSHSGDEDEQHGFDQWRGIDLHDPAVRDALDRGDFPPGFRFCGDANDDCDAFEALEV